MVVNNPLGEPAARWILCPDLVISPEGRGRTNWRFCKIVGNPPFLYNRSISTTAIRDLGFRTSSKFGLQTCWAGAQRYLY